MNFRDIFANEKQIENIRMKPSAYGSKKRAIMECNYGDFRRAFMSATDVAKLPSQIMKETYRVVHPKTMEQEENVFHCKFKNCSLDMHSCPSILKAFFIRENDFIIATFQEHNQDTCSEDYQDTCVGT